MRLLAAALATTGWLVSSAAWCLCPPPVAVSSPHGCCDERAGLSGMHHCCQTAPEAKARREDAVPVSPSLAPAVTTVLLDRPLAVRLVPPPDPARFGSAPPIVLRI